MANLALTCHHLRALAYPYLLRSLKLGPSFSPEAIINAASTISLDTNVEMNRHVQRLNVGIWLADRSDLDYSIPQPQPPPPAMTPPFLEDLACSITTIVAHLPSLTHLTLSLGNLAQSSTPDLPTHLASILPPFPTRITDLTISPGLGALIPLFPGLTALSANDWQFRPEQTTSFLTHAAGAANTAAGAAATHESRLRHLGLPRPWTSRTPAAVHAALPGLRSLSLPGWCPAGVFARTLAALAAFEQLERVEFGSVDPRGQATSAVRTRVGFCGVGFDERAVLKDWEGIVEDVLKGLPGVKEVVLTQCLVARVVGKGEVWKYVRWEVLVPWSRIKSGRWRLWNGDCGRERSEENEIDASSMLLADDRSADLNAELWSLNSLVG